MLLLEFTIQSHCPVLELSAWRTETVVNLAIIEDRGRLLVQRIEYEGGLLAKRVVDCF